MVYIKEYMNEFNQNDIDFKKEFEEEPKLVSIKQCWFVDEENMIYQELLKEEPNWDLIEQSMDMDDLAYTEWYKKDGVVSKRVWCKLGGASKAKYSAHSDLCLTLHSKKRTKMEQRSGREDKEKV